MNGAVIDAGAADNDAHIVDVENNKGNNHTNISGVNVIIADNRHNNGDNDVHIPGTGFDTLNIEFRIGNVAQRFRGLTLQTLPLIDKVRIEHKIFFGLVYF